MRGLKDLIDVSTSRASRYLAILFLGLYTLVSLAQLSPALAIEPVPVPLDTKAIDLSTRMELYSSKGDRIQVSTAPDQDKIVRRIEVSARQTGTRPSWIVFALANETNEQIERLIVAPHFRLAGSGVIWPDLGASRIAAITASQGFPPEREEGTDADVFRITLDPGTIVTYVAELRTPNLPKLYLWQPDAYKDKLASLTLYQGIIIGIAALLALFLTIVFVVKGAVIFPAAAALAWAVLAYV
ncbi:MAG: sensor domain-containing phosphodiesterase, partial [Hyphomicrobiales bacterium]|nr:sensor domain-containing phosphodiesterase [Hyphomicrobiales bacterium]